MTFYICKDCKSIIMGCTDYGECRKCIFGEQGECPFIIDGLKKIEQGACYNCSIKSIKKRKKYHFF